MLVAGIDARLPSLPFMRVHSRSFLASPSTLLLLVANWVSWCHALVLHNPTSASEYVEIVPGKPITITWQAESGDPASFKIKLRNRTIKDHNGQWVLVDNVSTASNQVTTNFLDLPPDPSYYIEADYYVGMTLHILYSGFNDLFPAVDAGSAHLKHTSNTGTSAPPPNPNTSAANQPPPGTTTSPPAQTLITQTLASTVTQNSGFSVISYTITTETAIPPSNSSPSGPTSSQPSTSSDTSKHSNLAAILGGVLGGACVILLVLAFCLLRRRRRSTAAVPYTDSEPSEPPVSPFGGFRVDRNTEEKGQLQRVLAERDALQVQHDSLQATSSSGVGGSSRTHTEGGDSELRLKQQIQTMNQRIMELEAQVNSNSNYDGATLSDMPPPNYVSATRNPMS